MAQLTSDPITGVTETLTRCSCRALTCYPLIRLPEAAVARRPRITSPVYPWWYVLASFTAYKARKKGAHTHTRTHTRFKEYQILQCFLKDVRTSSFVVFEKVKVSQKLWRSSVPVACIILFPVGSAVDLHDKGSGSRGSNVLHVLGTQSKNMTASLIYAKLPSAVYRKLMDGLIEQRSAIQCAPNDKWCIS